MIFKTTLQVHKHRRRHIEHTCIALPHISCLNQIFIAEDADCYKPVYFIGISIGSSLLGALVTACILLLRRFMKNRTKPEVISSNVDSYHVAQYEEIDEIELHTMHGSSHQVGQNTETSIEIPDNSAYSGDGQSGNSEISVGDRRNDYIDTLSSEYYFTTDEDGNDETNTKIDESGSNSTNSRHNPTNSYININANSRISYQSLVDDNREECDTNSYDELSETFAESTHYINLRI